ncbi:MAG: PQQ-binding-like beta-propeller repeat protein [Archangium sp.]|nr:PQQ-binding-like beta-propeller repeat protein [Archangium sp.]
MIRFRVGHSWQREPPGPGGPRDAFAFELEGINVLPGANDEPLVRIVTALVDTVSAMVVDGERAGQVSLEDVHLELCFWRTFGNEVTVVVIDLSQPPRQVRAPIAVELPTLVEATVKCARHFLRDVEQHRGDIETELVALEKRLKRLTSAVIEERPRREAPAPWSAVRSATGTVGFSLRDDDGRTLAWNRKTRAGLPPLLFDGELTLADGTHHAGLPFLAMMGLARSAAEGNARIGGQQVPPDQLYLAGLDLCLALRSRNPALGANPYVEALQVRCTDGLMAMRKPVPDTTMATVSPPRSTPGVPLAPVGDVRRVTLQPRWSRPVALGEEGGRILLGKRWAIVHSPHAAHAFTKAGATAFRHLSTRGVAIGEDGDAICATPERLLFYEGRGPTAQWLRDADGGRLGPHLETIDGVLVCPLGRRGVAGFARLSGRELWRFEPPRTQSITFSRVGTRVLVGTDGGTLYGIDAGDGQVRFKVKAGLPVARAPVAVRNRALVVLNRGEHSAIYLCDALSSGDTTPAGAIVWTRELILSSPCAPVWARGHTWLGGARDGRTVLVCLGPRGQVLWEKTIPCDARTLTLLPWEGGVLVADARGAATRVLPDGSAEWVLGSSGDELNRAIPITVRRRTLVVPGPVTRLVQPRGGRVLAELATGPRMLDLVTDAKLTIYVLREPGTLETFVPGTALAVVPSAV